MSDIYEHLCAFLETSGLQPESGANQLTQFWYKEERYYLRFFPNRQALRIFHPRVWHVDSHMEFGVATFIANDMNQDSFATKMFVNNDDHYIYCVAEIFATDAETVEALFFNYMNALSWAIVEFRDRTDKSMQEEDQEPPSPQSA